MNKTTSLYLDLIRVFAALVVFLHHASYEPFSRGQTWLPSFAHEMVIIFFVISGFVIALAADKAGDDWKGFAADRLSRLYSVIIPALVLTALLDTIGSRLAPKIYAIEIPANHYWERLVLAAGFLNQSWNLSSNPGSNHPLWSLAYEFWYYALLAGWVFSRQWTWKVASLVVFVALTGYKILLLLPIWLMGVAAYHVCRSKWLRPGPGLVLATITLALFVLLLSGALPLAGSEAGWFPHPPLFFSGRFGPDFVLGLIVTAHFVGVDALSRGWKAPAQSELAPRVIRFMAGRCFSLYVFHLPLLIFLKVTIPFDSASTFQVVLVLLLALVVIGALSEFTEQRREPWRRLFRKLFGLPAVSMERLKVGQKKPA